MKKLLLLSTVCLLASNAYAVDVRPYIEGRLISLNWLEATYKENNGFKEKIKDNGPGVSLEFGVKLSQFRIGVEGYYNDDITGELVDVIPVEGESKGLFLNGYFDIPLPNLEQVKPYIGAGIGRSWLKETADLTDWGYGKDSLKDEDFSWNVGAGINYEVNKNLDITLGYRYENLGKIEEKYSKTEFTNHKVSLGVRYTF